MRHPIPGLDYFPARVLIRRLDLGKASLPADASWPLGTDRGLEAEERRYQPSLAGPFLSRRGVSFTPPVRPKA